MGRGLVGNRLSMVSNFSGLDTAIPLDVKLVGVGSAGCATIVRLRDALPGTMDTLGIDNVSKIDAKPYGLDVMKIGGTFGTGGDAEKAAGMFLGKEEVVSRFVNGADVVVIAAGMGRGTGSGVAPLVADIANDSGAWTLAVVHMPFQFEGRRRQDSAEYALANLERVVDGALVIDNNDLIQSGDRTLISAFEHVQNATANCVKSVLSNLNGSRQRLSDLRESLRAACYDRYPNNVDWSQTAVNTGSSTMGVKLIENPAV